MFFNLGSSTEVRGSAYVAFQSKTSVPVLVWGHEGLGGLTRNQDTGFALFKPRTTRPPKASAWLPANQHKITSSCPRSLQPRVLAQKPGLGGGPDTQLAEFGETEAGANGQVLSPLGPLKTLILFEAPPLGCPPGFHGWMATRSVANLLGGWKMLCSSVRTSEMASLACEEIRPADGLG